MSFGSTTCPRCAKPLELKRGPHGAFYGCTGYPECKYTAKAPEADKVPSREEQEELYRSLRAAFAFAEEVGGFSTAGKWLRIAEAMSQSNDRPA